MRTITTTLYLFDELSEEAQSAAMDHVRESDWELYSWADDDMASLQAFADALGVKVECEIGLGGWGFTFARLLPDPDYGTVYHDRAAEQGDFRQYDSWSGSCPLTGFCRDDDLLDGVRAFLMGTLDDGLSFGDVVRDCLDRWATAVRIDVENAHSDEAIGELLRDNGHEFHENGVPA